MNRFTFTEESINEINAECMQRCNRILSAKIKNDIRHLYNTEKYRDELKESIMDVVKKHYPSNIDEKVEIIIDQFLEKNNLLK